jgi:hypothetical protein
MAARTVGGGRFSHLTERINAMTPATKRRWSYSLRTLFVVVTLLAWGLATRPYLVYGPVDSERYLFPSLIVPMFESYWDPGYDVVDYAPVGLNPALTWPALAMAGIIAWRIARRALEWRSERRLREQAAPNC